MEYPVHPRWAVGLLKDLVEVGHVSYHLWYAKGRSMLTDLGRYLSAPALIPPHDTYLEKLVTLNRMIRKTRPQRMLELGVEYGLSTWAMLSALDANNSGVLVSIDRNEFVDESRRAGYIVPDALKSRWQLKVGEAIDLVGPTLGNFDFIYEDFGVGIDQKLLSALWDSLNAGGLLFIAARTARTVKQDYDRFAEEKGGWFALAEGTKKPIATWGVMRKP